MERHQQDLVAQLLPGDVLVDVLRRLPPRSLAVSRCVSSGWRAAIDDQGLLRAADLFPRSLDALLLDYFDLGFTEFFSRPWATWPRVSGKLDFLPHREAWACMVQDHCNGLLLLEDCVCVANPATRRWAPLPPRPRLSAWCRCHFCVDEYLVYDPAVSLHYEVLVVPRVQDYVAMAWHHDRYGGRELDRQIKEAAWPLSPCILPVFSSRTGQWEMRSFRREGDAVGTIADVQVWCRKMFETRLRAVYWRRQLYVQGQTNFVMRISLAGNKYQVIKPPTGIGSYKNRELHLGRSEKGVYYAFLNHNVCPSQLRVWILEESFGQMEWVLKYVNDLRPVLACWNRLQQLDGPWVLQDINYYENHEEEDNTDELMKHQFEWNSDSDDFLEEMVEIEQGYCDIAFMGFHPYKEVIFLQHSESKGLAYHLNTSKVQDLGNICPKSYDICSVNTFPYTPCWMEELPGSN